MRTRLAPITLVLAGACLLAPTTSALNHSSPAPRLSASPQAAEYRPLLERAIADRERLQTPGTLHDTDREALERIQDLEQSKQRLEVDVQRLQATLLERQGRFSEAAIVASAADRLEQGLSNQAALRRRARGVVHEGEQP